MKSNETKTPDERVSIGLGLLSFIFPIFGWIYWGIKKNEEPVKAKTCGIVSTISFAINITLSLSSIIISIIDKV